MDGTVDDTMAYKSEPDDNDDDEEFVLGSSAPHHKRAGPSGRASSRTSVQRARAEHSKQQWSINGKNRLPARKLGPRPCLAPIHQEKDAIFIPSISTPTGESGKNLIVCVLSGPRSHPASFACGTLCDGKQQTKTVLCCVAEA